MVLEPIDLRNHAFFGGMQDGQIETILSLMRTESVELGTVIIGEDQPNDRIFFILEGQVEVSKKGISLEVFREGHAFGEMEVIDVMPAEATITATEPSRLVSLSNGGLHELSKKDIRTFAMLVMNLARDLSRRLRNMNRLYTEAAGTYAV